MKNWRSLIWHMPGRAWSGALKAAPITAWWRFGAAVVVSILVAGLILIIWLGPWSDGVEPERLNWLGWFGILLIIALLACVAFLFERSLSVDASRTGFRLRAGDGEEPPSVEVETKTTITPAPAAHSPETEERPPWER